MILSATSHIWPQSGYPHHTSSHDLVSDMTCSGSGDSSVALGVGIAQWLSDTLVIERSRVWVPAGAGKEFASPCSTVCADSYFGICSTPVLLQQHVKDPSHSTHSAGGRLQLNAHTLYIRPQKCRWQVTAERTHTLHTASNSDAVNWCIVVGCTQNLCRDSSSFIWDQPWNNWNCCNYFGGYWECRVYSHSFRITYDWSAVGLLACREQRYSCCCEALGLQCVHNKINIQPWPHDLVSDIASSHDLVSDITHPPMTWSVILHQAMTWSVISHIQPWPGQRYHPPTHDLVSDITHPPMTWSVVSHTHTHDLVSDITSTHDLVSDTTHPWPGQWYYIQPWPGQWYHTPMTWSVILHPAMTWSVISHIQPWPGQWYHTSSQHSHSVSSFSGEVSSLVLAHWIWCMCHRARTEWKTVSHSCVLRHLLRYNQD